MNNIKLKHYFKIWLMLTKNSFILVLSQRKAMSLFLLGKVLRFTVFISFLYFLVKGSSSLAGYTTNQVILFFLCFNLVDVLSQFLFREVYKFRPKIISGDFDLTLVKPSNPLFVSLMGGADIIDFFTIPPLILAIVFVASSLNPTVFQIFVFSFLILNSLLISAAFHIAVLSIAVVTMEVDHTIMIFRDLTSFGRFPIDIYKRPLQDFLTFVVPVGLMITLPAKVLMSLVTWQSVVASVLIGIFAFSLSIRLWNWALTKYTSASS